MMKPATQPVVVLKQMLERGENGCLQVHRPGYGSARIFLAEGQIRGAETPADGRAMLLRLRARGYLNSPQDAGLVDGLIAGEGLGMMAGRVPESAMSEVVEGLFHQVLLDFVFIGASHRFEAGAQVRPQRVQIGHDSLELLGGLQEVETRIAAWRDLKEERVLRQQGTAPVEPQACLLWELCAAGCSVSDLLEQSPWFAGRTLVQLIELVNSGGLVAEKSTEIPAFEDHASADRGMGQGHFTSTQDERVDLRHRAPALRTDGDRLDDAELSRKISVASEVLRVMVRAMDKASSDGQAQLQLVMDAAPIPLRVLFEGVELKRDGRLDESVITHNLRSRLPTEQRMLLQRGLTDLLDRALSQCMDTLPEMPADQLLSQVVGYQKRLGR